MSETAVRDDDRLGVRIIAVAFAIGVAGALGYIAANINDTPRIYVVDPSVTITTAPRALP